MIISIIISSHAVKSQPKDVRLNQFWTYVSLSFRQQTMPDMGRSIIFVTSQELYPSFSTAISKIETISSNYVLQDYILLQLYKRIRGGEFAKLMFANMFGCSQSLSNYMIDYMDNKYKKDKRYVSWEINQLKVKEEDMHTNDANNLSEIKLDTDDSLYVSTQIEAEFPGGPSSWTKYIQRSINSWDDAYNDSLNATNLSIEVGFTVLKDGKIDSIIVEGTNDKKLIDKITILFKSSEKWKPAIQDGNIVFARKKQKIAFKGSIF